MNRGVPLTLINPWYKDILAKYDHLKEVEIDDVYLKRELPVHLILGTSEYTRIKTKTTPKMDLLNLRALDGLLCLLEANQT